LDGLTGGRRTASPSRLATLAGSVCTRVGPGGWLKLPIPMSSGLPGDNLLRWLIIGSGTLAPGPLLTPSSGCLLRQLEDALLGQRRSAALLREVALQIPGWAFRLRLDHGRVPAVEYVSPGSQIRLGLSPEALLADAGLLAERLHPTTCTRCGR